jgi:sulfhydrogenase subunit beta (sulfur reductase)
MVILERSHLQQLFTALKKRDYSIVGPTRRGTAIILDEIHSPDDLPAGLGDDQHPASYRVRQRDDQRLFGSSVGPYSWKKYLYPPVLTLFGGKRTGKSFEFSFPHDGQKTASAEDRPAQLAFFGMHACDLRALQIHDAIFMNSQYPDPYYKSRRERLFIVAVNCSVAGGTCFCDSMGSGPRATDGYDLAMTEIVRGKEHYFIIETGSPRGAEVLKGIQVRTAAKAEEEEIVRLMEKVRGEMGRTLNTDGLHDILNQRFEDSRWDEVAKRCLACANCTMVCPTCFCATVEDMTDLTGTQAERIRKWDSCFTLEFTYIHGGSVRPSIRSRYRQWLTHKLAHWIDQFGTTGCVGCGRCITWCPVGIDITEEAGILRQHAARDPRYQKETEEHGKS